MTTSSFPKNQAELLQRAKQLAGLTLTEIATLQHLPIPADLKRDKGWVGMLIEQALGASASSRAEPDFPHLHIELKTIPCNRWGKPLETTYVCLAPLTGHSGVTWQTSFLRQKLAQVLWIPVEGERQIPLGVRRVGQPILWQPNASQEQRLQQDWEELMDLIVLGKVNRINATLGQVLQLRPKGANRHALTQAIDAQGNLIQTLPLGFYLRKEFTTEILQDFLKKR